MKLFDLFKEAVKILSVSGIETPKTDAEIIISNALGIDRIQIYLNRNLEIDEKDVEKVISMVEKRKEFIPLEYIIGYKYFWGYKFKVREGVLIPRFDTEAVIEIAKNICPNPKYILDIGTGTGVIGITLKKIFPSSYVVMCDISEVAIDVCKENVKDILGNTDGVEIIKSDVFEDIWECIGWGRFDLIVSNPPYISIKDYQNLPNDVKKEPITALLGGVSGLDFYIRIADKVKDFIGKNGKIILEVGDEKQAEKVKKIFYLKGFRNFITFKDINSKVRGVAILNY